MSSSGGPCPDCFSGAIHTGTPSGTITTIHGLPTYVAQPKDGVKPKGLIIMIPDAFGWEMPNSRLLCDAYAKKGGFLVYLPEFMNGHAAPASAIPLMDKIMKPASWLTTILYKPFYILRALVTVLTALFHNRSSVCKPRILSFFQSLRTSPPPFETSDLKIGAAGFCWGGMHTILLCQDNPSSRVARHESQNGGGKIERLVDCGFTAHPSMLKVPEDIEKVVLPLSVAVGNEDMALRGDKIVRMKEILEVKNKGDHECVIMPGAKHGFAVRTHPDNKEQIVWADKAEEQAIVWFGRWFA